MRGLKPGKGLNDKIIEFFMKLVEIYSRESTPIKAKCLTTKFTTKLLEDGYNYKMVERWMKKM